MQGYASRVMEAPTVFISRPKEFLFQTLLIGLLPICLLPEPLALSWARPSKALQSPSLLVDLMSKTLGSASC